jgi:hypothetical protein
LAVVDGPAVDAIGEGFLEVSDGGPAYSNFDELALVNKDFEIVLTSFSEDLGAYRGLESVALGRFGSQAFWVELDLMTRLVDVPAKKSYIGGGVRASKPSGVLIMTSSLSSF